MPIANVEPRNDEQREIALTLAAYYKLVDQGEVVPMGRVEPRNDGGKPIAETKPRHDD